MKRFLAAAVLLYSVTATAVPGTILRWALERVEQPILVSKSKIAKEHVALTQDAAVEAYSGLITEADIWGLEYYENNTENCKFVVKGYTKIPQSNDTNTYWFLVCLEEIKEGTLWGTLIYNGVIIEIDESPWWWPL